MRQNERLRRIVSRTYPRRVDDEEDGDWPGRCQRCGATLLYSGTYDAAFCPQEDRWDERPSGDRSCEFCAHRPDRPSLARDLRVEDLWGQG